MIWSISSVHITTDLLLVIECDFFYKWILKRRRGSNSDTDLASRGIPECRYTDQQNSLRQT